MDDDLDPGPYRAPRSASNSRISRGRGRGGGRGWRSTSVQRDPADNVWRKNQNDDVQPWRRAHGPSDARDNSAPPQKSLRGRPRFTNVHDLEYRANAGMQQTRTRTNPQADHYNQRRGNSNNSDNFQQQHSNPRKDFDKNRRNFTRTKFIGFKRLEEIAQAESQDALAKLIESKEAFLELIQSPIERFDVFVLIIECMAKVCQSSFDELKLNLLRDTCNSSFIVSLKSYMMELPYPQAKAANNMYWKDQDAFWKNLIVIFECIINTSPTLALNKCRSLVEATSMACLVGLKERHEYNLPQEYASKLKDLRERMNNFENHKEAGHFSRKGFKAEDGTPPENFRELSIMPTREDLLQRRPFIRPNIVDGAYQDVEHYLDVQFRLLREDCFGPLREGLNQYIEDPKRRKYDHIRVLHNVKFAKPYVSQTKIGSFVQIDMTSNKNFKRINWSNSKRFIFGSLVLFTKDNCKSFIVGTILDRETKYLMQGLIPVLLMNTEFNDRLYNEDDTYTMIESEVYFEPYYHVLRALQDPTFPEHIAMKKYIVDVNPEPKHPSYLNPGKEFAVTIKGERRPSLSEYSDSEDELAVSLGLRSPRPHAPRSEQIQKVKFTVLQEETWPGKDILQFNDSQLDAYKLALTHELAVIQGPPGTGKTYLGIKVAKTLFQNLRKDVNGCLMLVICYTNHALDQFLEALLNVTPSIARIGGQSRNEAMDPINITNLRRNISKHCDANQVFIDQKLALKVVVSEFQKATVFHDVILNGVLKCKILSDIPEIGLLCRFYNASHGKEDALFQWLFEHIGDYYTDVEALVLEENGTKNEYADLEKETRKRTGVQLDDQETIESEKIAHRASLSSFSLEETNLKLKELISKYKECSADPAQQYHLRFEIQFWNSRKELFTDMSQYRLRRVDVRITERTNFYRFTPVDRWTLYFTWIQGKVLETKNEVGRLQARVNTLTTAYEEARMLLDMQVLKDRKVVGMTTSGAARMRKLLQTLAPPIVIVEEAAEVLEQHIITSLTKACTHLILIGDHQQLRPSASHMKLAKHYKIEVSLFERMITNGIHSRRLGVQHRMRPEIAALICPHIYPDLQNHPTVYDFPDVMGMTKNLFFFSHDHQEEVLVENMSRTNHKEADLVLLLANYLMQQGYTAEDVTILAAYKGQMFYLRKESDKYIHLKGVKITVVDNYQGEESKIILLSLVRNNEGNKIGFLGTANRICVALSRAKEGFYIFGNIDILKANSELWKNIATTLENGNSLGTSLTLKCQNHPDNLTTISKIEDFEEVPEGGCKALCNFALRRCGHKCQLFCHGYDREHTNAYTSCPRKCEKILCDLGHVCPKKCANECGLCTRKVKKTLPCGHEMDIPCHLEPDDPVVKCTTMVDVTLADCGHKAQKMCYVRITDVQCTVKCEYRVERCGHGCLRKCHVQNDPDHEKYLCKKACAKAKVGCTAGLEGDRGEHQCVKMCYESCDDCNVKVVKRRSTCKHVEQVTCTTNVDEIPCMKKCARKLPCNHFCKMKCSETCGNCMDMVAKEIPYCKHIVKIMCKTEPTRKLCIKKCERTMSCGHKCKGICGEDCNPAICTKPSSRKMAAPCGHQVTLPCNVAAMPADKLDGETLAAACTAACGAELACGHVCGGSCARCRRGALHAPCTQPCHRNNICGHQCEEPCNQICPPCKKRCEVQCKHSRCRQLCGAPCTPCQEACGRRCAHGGTCARRCGEECTRPPCGHACGRRLPCGHACRGLCGEPCPTVCKLCDPDNFPRDFLGDEFDDDARFILLQDCGHVMEVENMDNMMWGSHDRETINIRKCPFCRKPIINTGRYKDFVNKIFKEEINPVKTKIYGTQEQIEAKKKDLHKKIQEFRDKYVNVLKVDTNIKTVYLNLQSVAKTTKNVSKLQLDMESICLNILDMIAECYKKYLDAKLTELKTELTKQTRLLCQVFEFKVKAGVMLKISEQQQKDVNLEIKRMNSIVQFAKLIGHVSYAAAKSLPAVQLQHDAATAAVFSYTVFDENKAMKALNDLQEAMKVSDVVKKQERDMIVKAIGMIAGTWYKCPKGHFYCIGNCGQAVEASKCPDCGAKIVDTNIKTVYLNLQSVVKTTKKVSKLQLDMESICLNILDMIADCYKKYLDAKLTELKTELTKQTRLLCQVFEFNVKAGVMLKISEQQQKDVNLEIKRMNSIVQFAKLIGHVSYAASKSLPAVQSHYDKVTAAVFSYTVFNENKAMKALNDLQEAIKVSDVVSKQERDMIVKVIGGKAGSWYKCSNGHIYSIADCGGAMEESKCPDCGAKIGGTNHALTAGNAHAPEMDGSRFAAWSQEYNNMANFVFD